MTTSATDRRAGGALSVLAALALLAPQGGCTRTYLVQPHELEAARDTRHPTVPARHTNDRDTVLAVSQIRTVKRSDGRWVTPAGKPSRHPDTGVLAGALATPRDDGWLPVRVHDARRVQIGVGAGLLGASCAFIAGGLALSASIEGSGPVDELGEITGALLIGAGAVQAASGLVVLLIGLLSDGPERPGALPAERRP